jgi:hypothetical protein
MKFSTVKSFLIFISLLALAILAIVFWLRPGGYTPNFQLQQQIKGGQRGSIGTKRVYIMLKNGQEYGRITIDLLAPFNDQIPGMIRLSYAINPSGSRVLR